MPANGVLRIWILALVSAATIYEGSAFQLGSFAARTHSRPEATFSETACKPARLPVASSAQSWRQRQSCSLRMAAGDTVQVLYNDVGQVQEGLAAAIADGCQVIELEVPTTNRFKDAALSQIYQANTIFAREVVRMFTQPAELCMVFPDESECKIALAEYGGQVPFGLSCLRKPNPQGPGVYYYMVMHPVFDVREYIQAEELLREEIQPKGGSMVLFNAELFKLRKGGIGGYYPDIFFPKLAEARKRMMPQVHSAYYFRVFRGPPVGALYKKYPGPWQVLKAVEGGFEVLWEGEQQAPPDQDFVFQKLRASA
mmetsp:Transcript_26227/g.62375  ORF Transcript_26227/g.62375 Transcript_26227/m.62375 type:complete len:312 (-) Transcript_26227:102-1037(-)|eukprot:CAMPEP_0177700768 /NCGR_PEP_ID=MMETSP0484_2-20121128/6265_1 /TAXON_ID=354590 /ORGANISM="Rhodomonas lens, Strain RHODO" /LENGTH=311 /DNA_ID=CAMNT_0019211979 /DNA_START=60 /DNA_END=995 /DNA_ORIENTATION=+